MTTLRPLEDLRVDARYHRERRDLYRAKMHGPRPTSPVQLKELERACILSSSRLRRAEQEQQAETEVLEARASKSVRGLAGLQGDDVRRVNTDRTAGSVLGEPGETRLA
jgi:hypothetical protein